MDAVEMPLISSIAFFDVMAMPTLHDFITVSGRKLSKSARLQWDMDLLLGMVPVYDVPGIFIPMDSCGVYSRTCIIQEEPTGRFGNHK